jgi:hypothetical protein
MDMDPELQAMQKIADALTELSDEARRRVIHWAAARYEVSTGITIKEAASPDSTSNNAERSPFADFADLFYAADPNDNSQKALVASYWLSLQNAGEAFPSQSVNSLLKNLGFQIPNITDALSQTMREKPALIIQTRKSGNSKQGRKLYKITDAGLRRVKSMMKENENV